jgi:sarcosine oxidase
MSQSYVDTAEVIVLGLGGLGSAALYWASRRLGKDVLGLEQFSLGHDMGASQDHSRIIRLSYDDPSYTALTPYTYIHWREVEAESGVQLVFRTGGILFGPGETQPDAAYAGQIERYHLAMKAAGIPHEHLSPAEAMYRYPQFHLEDSDQVVYSANDGFVDPRKANAAHINLARSRGARIIENTPVQHVRPTGTGVEIETAAGTFAARRLIIAASAWTNRVLQGIGLQVPLTVTEEQVTYFSSPKLRQFVPERFPVWIWHGEDCFYGLPVYGEVATKAGQDVGGDEVTVETRRLKPNPRPLERLTHFLNNRIPDFVGPILYTKPCLYTMPPDRNFILDSLPGYPHIAMAVGAGHSFKFASMIGRILSDLALDSQTVFPIDIFRLDRPAITDPNFSRTFRPLG